MARKKSKPTPRSAAPPLSMAAKFGRDKSKQKKKRGPPRTGIRAPPPVKVLRKRISKWKRENKLEATPKTKPKMLDYISRHKI